MTYTLVVNRLVLELNGACVVVFAVKIPSIFLEIVCVCKGSFMYETVPYY